MSFLDELLVGNAEFAANEWDPCDKDLLAPPVKGLAVVACMDTRYNVERVLGLKHGDAKVIRNAGNVLDDGTLRSLVVGIHLLRVERIVVMGHTKCGMTQVGRGEYRIAHSISERSDIPLYELMKPGFQRWLHGFHDVEDNVRQSVQLIRNHPYIPDDIEVFGLIYDNDTGLVRPLVSDAANSEPVRHPPIQ